MAEGDILHVQMRNGRIFRYVVSQEDATCQKCGSPIHWVTTHNDKQMPVDVPDDAGDTSTTCHFDTCKGKNF